MESLPDPTAGSNAARLAHAGATWFRAVLALPRSEQQRIWGYLEALLGDTPRVPEGPES
jgi:hypothetical protein